MNNSHAYKYLRDDPWSRCKLLFLLDPRKFRADFIYGQSVGDEARTPEELAADFDLPLEAVQEAIHYCTHNLDQVLEQRARDNAEWDEYEKLHPTPKPPA
jgi:hypothetical protein